MVGPVTLQIVETASGEKELRHGARVLAKEFALNRWPNAPRGELKFWQGN